MANGAGSCAVGGSAGNVRNGCEGSRRSAGEERIHRDFVSKQKPDLEVRKNIDAQNDRGHRSSPATLVST